MSLVGRLVENTRPFRSDRWRRRLLIAWPVFGVFEIVASAGLVRRPRLGDALLELLVLSIAGVVHASLLPTTGAARPCGQRLSARRCR